MNRAKRFHGYTLLEVLVAVAILAIILPALTRFVVSSRQTQSGSEVSEVATGLAQRTLDSLAQIPAGSRTNEAVSTDLSSQGRTFHLIWSYRDASSRAYTGATPGAVNVTVRFTMGNANRQISLDGVLP